MDDSINRQLTFSDFGENNSVFSVIDGIRDENNRIKCYHNSLQEVNYMTCEELFEGFNKLQAITFSYDLKFINSLLRQFEYAEILLGGSFIVENDQSLKDCIIDVLTDQQQNIETIKKNKRMISMMQDGDLIIKTAKMVMDHRKVYILSSDDGKTRVITASANMSAKAWNGSHMETYEYDDSNLCFEERKDDFETAWDMAWDIPYSIVSVEKKTGLKDLPVVTQIQERNEAFILKQESGDAAFENVKYVIEQEKLRAVNREILKDVSFNTKNGLVEINAKKANEIVRHERTYQERIRQQTETVENYPRLHIDYGEAAAYLNEEKLDLNPPEAEVRADIDTFIRLFDNFDDFVPSPDKLKESHYKLMNVMFASPFNAKLRCMERLTGQNLEESVCLPMFTLLASKTANSGKTFMVKALLKAMTGKRLDAKNKSNLKSSAIPDVQSTCKSVPVFVDEIDGKYWGYVKSMIKASSSCEIDNLDEQPMIIFASNDILEPDETLRKRMVFLRYEGALPSTIDQSAYKGKGRSIMKDLGTAFYRLYLGRMIVGVKTWIDQMVRNELPDTWYPDVMALSSKTIRGIFNEYGSSIPSYMRELSWNDDFSQNASYISDDAIKEICELRRIKKNVFHFKDGKIIIELGTDSESLRKYQSWLNTLPQEMEAKGNKTMNGYLITINEYEFLKRVQNSPYKFPGRRLHRW